MTKFTDNYEHHGIDPHFLGFCDVINLENNPVDVIRAYTKFINAGLIPTENILLAIAKGFDAYLEGEGKKLDSCFNLKSKQGVGSPVSHRRDNEWKSYACYLIWHYRKTEELEGKMKTSISKVAEKIIEDFKIPHPDHEDEYFDAKTLERYYENGMKDYFDRMYDLQLKHGRNDFYTLPKIYADALKGTIQNKI